MLKPRTPLTSGLPLSEAIPEKERLLFDITWGAWASDGSMRVGPPWKFLPAETDRHLVFRSQAWNNKFFQTFYPVRDTLFLGHQSQRALPRSIPEEHQRGKLPRPRKDLFRSGRQDGLSNPNQEKR